jgi:two-component system chemotaxis sensor kinase CheA
MANWIDLEYFEIFYQESLENLNFLEELIDSIDNSVGQTELDHLFRVFHSLKGIAGMMGLDTLSDANHLIENKLKLFNPQDEDLIEDFKNWLIDSRDCLHDMVHTIADAVENEAECTPDLSSLLQRLKKSTDVVFSDQTSNGECLPSQNPVLTSATMATDIDSDPALNELYNAIEEYLDNLEEHLKADDIHMAQAILHTMKGDCAVFDKKDLAGLIHSIEDSFERKSYNLKENFELFKYCILSNIYQDQLDIIEEFQSVTKSELKEIDLDEKFILALKDLAQLIKKGLVEGIAVETEILELMSRLNSWQEKKGLDNFFSLLQTCEMVGWTDLSQNNFLKDLVSEIRFLISQFKDNKNLENPGDVKVSEESESTSEIEAAAQNFPERNQVSNNTTVTKEIEEASSVQKVSKGKEFFKIESKFVNNLIDISSEFVVAKNILLHSYNELIKKHGAEAKELEYVLKSINRLSAELQDNVIKMRLVPCKEVFKKAPKIVRDISRKQKKEIILEITGEETEIDKTIGEKVSDALLHIIRNCCDHGIESPGEREQKNKERKGLIKLSACYQQSFLKIEISDDGNGIDTGKVRSKILENQLISPNELKNISDEDVAYFIFHPGLSTAEEVSDISGRGVGMDVVKSNIEALGGSVELKTKLGEGSVFTLYIPINTAVKKSLIVEADNEQLGFILDQIDETIKVSEENIFERFGQHYLSYRNKITRIVNPLGLVKRKKVPLVLYRYQGHSYAYIVDSFVGHQELVIKEAPKILKRNKDILGVSVLGDGRAVVVMDLIQIASGNLIHTGSNHRSLKRGRDNAA